jgi:tRNA-splicing ligase RtcB
MMRNAIEAVNDVFPDARFGAITNEPHNFARLENHFGKNVMVHRKGATSAKNGEEGMIPGSQGTHSYLVRGKGNSDSFESCSHGSGRLLSRTKAREILSVEDESQKLNELGIIHSIRHPKDLDEAPSSYKNIETVMNNQRDLAEIVVQLKPRGVIKG